jgi:hypothetical protein
VHVHAIGIPEGVNLLGFEGPCQEEQQQPTPIEFSSSTIVESYSSKLSIHPGRSKMYQDLKSYYWWTKMKKEITAYVARCDNCCRVKAIHMKPGLLQPLSIPS